MNQIFSKTQGLKTRLAQKSIVIAPGVYDALTAAIATEAGFECLYLSGAGIAYTRLGRPDIGLVSAAEVGQTVSLIRERVATPLVVDADTGFGNALNVERTVRMFEQAGASALQLEDQTFPKRCGHLSDKGVIPAIEMVGKIKAAVDSRRSSETLIIARTDAVAVEGFDAAIARAHAYAEAGADLLFVEAPRSQSDLGRITEKLAGTLPLMANMVEGGQTPILPAPVLEEMGFSLVIFPGAIVRAIARTAQDLYQALHRDGTTDAMRNHMFDFDGLNAMIGTHDILARGKKYEAGGA